MGFDQRDFGLPALTDLNNNNIVYYCVIKKKDRRILQTKENKYPKVVLVSVVHGPASLWTISSMPRPKYRDCLETFIAIWLILTVESKNFTLLFCLFYFIFLVMFILFYKSMSVMQLKKKQSFTHWEASLKYSEKQNLLGTLQKWQ